jgi:hypothetical protein
MSAMNDWRLQGQERYLTNAKFVRRIYVPPSPSWDHDHCEFCGAKVSLNEGDLREGYVTLDGKHWICDVCFNDFKERFRWVVVRACPKV